MPEVSVLNPRYGNNQGRASLPAVTTAWPAQSVPASRGVATCSTGSSAASWEVPWPGSWVLLATGPPSEQLRLRPRTATRSRRSPWPRRPHPSKRAGITPAPRRSK